MSLQNQKLIVIAGPTAVGKSSAAVRLAKRFNGEIISADSMQVYRGMDVGTAKITADEMQGIPHHMLDVADPGDSYSVAAYAADAKKAADDIFARGKLPILCGGTGFYIQALIYGISFEEEEDGGIREELEAYVSANGPEALHRLLMECDPASAAKIPPANVKRVLRAVQFYRLHAYPISEHNRREAEKHKDPQYPFSYFVLWDERRALCERIDRRVDLMMENGLYEEVQRLKADGVAFTSTAMQGIGYKELYNCPPEAGALHEAAELIKTRSRQYAKRQMTWFRREKDAVWLNIQDGDPADAIESYL